MTVLPWRRLKPAAEPPQRGEYSHAPCAEPCPQCGFSKAQEEAILRLLQRWHAVQQSTHCGEIVPRCVSVVDHAAALVRDLQAIPELSGKHVRSAWIKDNYPIPVPFPEFAKELAKLMQRKRVDGWRRGKRITSTVYVVP